MMLMMSLPEDGIEPETAPLPPPQLKTGFWQQVVMDDLCKMHKRCTFSF